MRKQYLQLRNDQNKEELLNRSSKIVDTLLNMECVSKAKNIMCFISFDSEVETHQIINKWLLQGKNVSVPYIEKSSEEFRLMHAIAINDFSELKPGSFGILEPPFQKTNIVAPEQLDLIIVPGSVFDVNKNRMGYGGGYYDRYLIKTSNTCIKIGVCYEFQVIDQIPHEEYDVPVDILVTDKRIIY